MSARVPTSARSENWPDLEASILQISRAASQCIHQDPGPSTLARSIAADVCSCSRFTVVAVVEIVEASPCFNQKLYLGQHELHSRGEKSNVVQNHTLKSVRTDSHSVHVYLTMQYKLISHLRLDLAQELARRRVAFLLVISLFEGLWLRVLK